MTWRNRYSCVSQVFLLRSLVMKIDQSDLQTLLEIARIALSDGHASYLVSIELDLSDEELDRLYSIIEKVAG